MNTTSMAQRGPVQTTSPDPAVEIGRAIQRLWHAQRGNEMAKRALSRDSHREKAYLDETYHQITEWLGALEVIATYTVANSLEGAMLQMALAHHEAIGIGDGSGDVAGQINKIQRLLRSAGDVVFDELGARVDSVRSTVMVYSWFGDREAHPNWLHDIDEWAAAARGEKDAAA